MPDPEAEIAVLGAGVVGLTTALELASRGVPVTVYSDPRSTGASRAAPALFTPYPGADAALFRRRTERSFERLRRMAEAGPDSESTSAACVSTGTSPRPPSPGWTPC